MASKYELYPGMTLEERILFNILRELEVLTSGGNASGPAYINGGNTYGANATIGLTDAFNLSIKTNNTDRLVITSTGDVYSNGTLGVRDVAHSGTNWDMKTRDSANFPNFPVVTLRATTSNTVTAMDIMPNGTATPETGGVCWFDVCNQDRRDATGEIQTARVGVFSNKVQFGSLSFGGPVLDIEFIRGNTDNIVFKVDSNQATYWIAADAPKVFLIDYLTSNVSIGSAGSFGGGKGNLFIAKSTLIPSSNPVNGFIQYVDPADNKLKVRGPSGTVTTLAVA